MKYKIQLKHLYKIYYLEYNLIKVCKIIYYKTEVKQNYLKKHDKNDYE